MAIQLTSTKACTSAGIKALVYGESGSGKTTLAGSLVAHGYKVVIISAEAGLMPLRQWDIPVIEVTNMAELKEAYDFLVSSTDFDTVCLDSISEIAEVLLASEKGKNADGRKAYGEMQDKLIPLVRDFRDLPGKHVYFTAKLAKLTDESGKLLFGPSMPGTKLGPALPYYFDEVFYLSTFKTEDGATVRAVLTACDDKYVAKDRSGSLGIWERADLGRIFNKIRGINDGNDSNED